MDQVLMRFEVDYDAVLEKHCGGIQMKNLQCVGTLEH